jgi:hypothetical protein
MERNSKPSPAKLRRMSIIEETTTKKSNWFQELLKYFLPYATSLREASPMKIIVNTQLEFSISLVSSSFYPSW